MPDHPVDAHRPAVDPRDDAGVRSRLARAHVAIVGCGGLGSNVAAMLVRSGLRTVTVIDFDVVDETNLNRQHFFREHLGMRKTAALADVLTRIDDTVDVRTVDVRIDANTLLEAVGPAEVVVEAVDGADTKAVIANTLLSSAPHTPLVSASGLAGFSSANDVTTERIGENFYLVGDLTSDVRTGLPLLASRVMLAAAHQAHITTRILLGHPDV